MVSLIPCLMCIWLMYSLILIHWYSVTVYVGYKENCHLNVCPLMQGSTCPMLEGMVFISWSDQILIFSKYYDPLLLSTHLAFTLALHCITVFPSLLYSPHHWDSCGLLLHYSLPSSPMLRLTWVATTGVNNNQGVVVLIHSSYPGRSP